MKQNKHNQKIIVVMPAYNAEKTLEKTVQDIPKNLVSEIIICDDASQDKTIEIAEKLKLIIFKHKDNQGYGANQKTCYTVALERKADIVIMLHPDFQYDPKALRFFICALKNNGLDVVLGSRIRSRAEALAGGMPLYKYIGNRFLTLLENLVSGQNLSEWHSGMRAYKREVLKKINFTNFSDDFSFDTEMLFAIVEENFNIGEAPVPVRYFKDSSSINFWRSVKYGLNTVYIALRYFFRKLLKKQKRIG